MEPPAHNQGSSIPAPDWRSRRTPIKMVHRLEAVVKVDVLAIVLWCSGAQVDSVSTKLNKLILIPRAM